MSRKSAAKKTYKMREPKSPPEPVEPGSFRGMSAARVEMASCALNGDSSDTTPEDWEALDEYIALGGNIRGL